jgi:hypothetical protein
MTAQTDDEPTVREVLAILDDDVVPQLDATAGALITRRDGLLDRDSDEGEALATAADLLAQAWANTRRAAEIIRDDCPDSGVPDDTLATPKLRVVRQGSLWYVIDHRGVYLAFDHTQAGAFACGVDIARRFAA